MSSFTEIRDPFVEAVDQYLGRGAAEGPSWVGSIREAALDHFQKSGLPTLRNEQWRFTNLKALRATRFGSVNGGGSAVSGEAIEPYLFGEMAAHLLVFVNGRYVPGLSRVEDEGGLVVKPLGQAMEEDAEALESHLARHALPESDPFIALNTALMEEGVFVHVAEGAEVKKPVHVLSVTTEASEPIMTHPRVLIVAEEGAKVSVIEQYVGLGEGVYLTNAVTELVAEAHTHVSHYLVEHESRSAYNITTLLIRQANDSYVGSHTALLGGAVVRNNIHPIIDGENSHCLINGLYLPTGSQHMDNNMRVEHAKPNCESRQYYKGILADEGSSVFTGRIIVHPDAQKTDAVQSNASLLLSDDAQANMNPQLEIYADDVKCTHGCTAGELDADAMYYLRARGIPMSEARRLLIFGFIGESLDRMGLAPVRQGIEEALHKKLQSIE